MFGRPLWRELGAKPDIQPGDEEILKKGTVDFVAFSYYFSSIEGEDTEVTEGNQILGGKNPSSGDRLGMADRSKRSQNFFELSV